MTREQRAAVFYGEDRVPPPWATDCPVRFDVWLSFAQSSATFNLVDARSTLFQDRTDNGLIDWSQALPYLEMLVPSQPPIIRLTHENPNARQAPEKLRRC